MPEGRPWEYDPPAAGATAAPWEADPPAEGGLGRFGRHVAARAGRGLASGVGFAADIPAHAMNTLAGRNRLGEALIANPGQPGLALISAVTGRLHGFQGPPLPDMGPNIAEPVMQGAMTELAEGMIGEEALTPQNAPERYAGQAAEFAGSGIAPGGIMARAARVPRAALPALAAQDTAIGATQGAAFEGVRDITDSEGAAAAAALAVPFTPAAGAAAVRSALGGGTRRMGAALQDADDINAALAAAGRTERYQPTASDAGGSDVAAVSERAGSMALFSRDAVAGRAAANDAALGAEAERLAREADRLAGFTTGRTESGAQAGAALWDGLRADADSWYNRSQAAAQRAEARAGAAITAASGGRPVMVNVTPLLQRMRQAAARQQEWGTIDPNINDLTERLRTMAAENGGLIPLEPAIRLKTHIGNLTRWSGAAPGADVALYRGLYGQLGEEIGNGVGRLGRPAATRLWRASQRQWAEHFERVRHYLDPVEAKLATPEHIAESVLATRTPSRAQALRDMVGERRWNQVRAFALRRMGSATPSGIEGTLAPGAEDVFSPVTFATNWNKMEKSGHLDIIFGGPGNRAWAQLRPELDRLARVAGRVQRTRKTIYNPSGTAGALTSGGQVLGLGGGAALSIATGNATPLLMVIGSIGGANVSSRLMMSPRFVRWLAQNGEMPVDRLGPALVRLQAVIDQEEDPEARAEMERLRDELAQRQAQ